MPMQVHKPKILFVITQFYKGGAEAALLNLFKKLKPEEYEIDFLILDQATFKDAKSLIDYIPPWIDVYNAAEKEGRWALVTKVIFRIWRKLTKRQLVRPSALKFIKGKQYDYAVSYGEWLPPEFVARKVIAKRKAIWVHCDIDKADYVDERILFRYDLHFTNYIFVSEKSMQGALEKYPFLKGREYIIHNMVDERKIIELAEKDCEVEKDENFILVTVANLREEKNHLRQIEVHQILKKRGLKIKWLNIGSTANIFVHEKVKEKIEKCGLESEFLLLGADENPYRYMKRADAVAVLSDHESWSLVISEAKILGIPIIATKTSGALSQLEDQVNGILCEFNAEDIANKIEDFLKDAMLQKKIRKNLKGFSMEDSTMKEFREVFCGR